MCISSRLRILNGRTFGDSTGKFTFYQYNGNSVIDYCLIYEGKNAKHIYFFMLMILFYDYQITLKFQLE